MIFSDKTGTLTMNKMVYKKCQINGNKYGETEGPDDTFSKLEGMNMSGIKKIKESLRREFESNGSLIVSKSPNVQKTDLK